MILMEVAISITTFSNADTCPCLLSVRRKDHFMERVCLKEIDVNEVLQVVNACNIRGRKTYLFQFLIPLKCVAPVNCYVNIYLLPHKCSASWGEAIGLGVHITNIHVCMCTNISTAVYSSC